MENINQIEKGEIIKRKEDIKTAEPKKENINKIKKDEIKIMEIFLKTKYIITLN